VTDPPAASLVELLAMRVRDTPERPAFTFDNTTTTFAELWQRVNASAGQLLAADLQPGERVVMALPNGAEFLAAFYGAQRAGGIAVPAFPGFGPEHLLRLAGLCGARLIVLPSAAPAGRLAQLRTLTAAQGVTVLVAAGGIAGGGDPAVAHQPFPPVAPDDIAYLQYTSGSTGDPKGVQLSHANLLTNVRQMIAGMQITPQEIFVSWLPVYHDMGLILMTMAPFYLAAELHLLPTNLKDVRPWLETLSRRRGTFTAAPDYAYRLCLRQVPGAEAAAYDLSHLRVALNAAEPVRARTLDEFERAFGLQSVMVAGYGLAEATVGVSMWPPGTPPRVDQRGLVSVGRPFPGIEIQITRGPALLPAGEVGEIVVRSPANTAGYFRNPTATADLVWRPGTVRTGDLGYVDPDGNLFIAGRLKNVIKRAGQTIYPQEVEEVVDTVPGLRYSAALGIDRGRAEGEQVYVFAEVRAAEARAADALPREALHALGVAIVDQVYAQLGFRPGRVYLLRPRSLPLTYNGKLQHAQLREDYLSGVLARRGDILYPDL
jgi:acyl-CoA synthetase (AMP-forming)/AMP-acid ligase II